MVHLGLVWTRILHRSYLGASLRSDLGPAAAGAWFPWYGAQFLHIECSKLTGVNTGDQSGNISVRSFIPAVTRATDF